MGIIINGFGRMGRSIARLLLSDGYKIAGINDIAPLATLAHLLSYDSTHGVASYHACCEDSMMALYIDEADSPYMRIPSYNAPSMDTLILSLGSSLRGATFIEASGHYVDKEILQKLVDAGARAVIVCTPAPLPTYIYGVNEGLLEKRLTSKEGIVFSTSSCTTNAIAPIIKELSHNYHLAYGSISTVHSYTNNQRLVDSPHADLRRSRAACENIIPTPTKSYAELPKVLPEVGDIFNGISYRVPIKDVSICDLILMLEVKNLGKEEVLGVLGGIDSRIIRLDSRPLVSSDYLGMRYSGVIATDLINISHTKEASMLTLRVWFDNEISYSARVVDMIGLVHEG